MRFDIVTVFPQVFDSYFNESMIKKARVKKLVNIRVRDLRRFSRGKHKKVDDRPYGGGPGMVLKIEPIARAIGSILRNSKFEVRNPKQNGKSKFPKSKTKILLFSAAGKQFTQKMAREWAKKYSRIIMICGHYEGVDARLQKIIKNWKPRTRTFGSVRGGLKIENLSIGPYVLTGGELPAMVAIDAIIRHIPGVLGKEQSLEEKRYGVGVPMYTRPEIFSWKGKNYCVPKVLLSGDHKKIENWRKKTVSNYDSPN